jgi:hypothetical protein
MADKTIKEIEAEIMGDIEELDITPKVKKNKQDELPGMPEKSPLVKQADKVIDIWEDLKIIKRELNLEIKKLLPLMKEENKDTLNLKDNNGDCIEIKRVITGEKVTINQKKAKGEF